MSLLSTIEYQKGFSELEKKIADYLIEHKEDVIHMNLKELALLSKKSLQKQLILQQQQLVVFVRNWEKKILMTFVFILPK